MIRSAVESSPAAQLYSQRHFEKIRASSLRGMTQALRDLAQNGEVGRLLSPYTRRLLPEELIDSPLDPEGPAAKIFRPKELSRFLDRLWRRTEILTLWVGNNANLTALGELNLERATVIGDLDLTLISANDKPIVSAESLYDRLVKAGATFRPGHVYYHRGREIKSDVVGEIDFVGGDDKNPFRLAFLTLKRYPASGIVSTVLYAKQDMRVPSRLDVIEWSVADIGFPSKETGFHRVKEMAFMFPREDSLAFLLIPKPDEQIPFNVWLIDPQRATDKNLSLDTIVYPPQSTILLANSERKFRGVLSAQEALIRGQRLAFRRNKQVPPELFWRSAREIQAAARIMSPVSHSDRIAASIKLEQISIKVDSVVREYPSLILPFLNGSIGKNIFPRIGQTLDLKTRSGRTVGEEVLAYGFPRNGPEPRLSDIIIYLTGQAESHGLPVWVEDRARHKARVTQSPFARNIVSPFFPKVDLKDEPYGADISFEGRRIVDTNLLEALERVSYLWQKKGYRSR